MRGAEGQETWRAIRAVAHREAIFSPDIADRLLHYFADAPADKAFPELTDREHKIPALVAQGLTNQAIAGLLALSPKTVRNQISTILSKLQLPDRAQAIVRARKAGLGS